MVVGDSIWDIEAAKEAGVRVAAVMTGGAFSRAELEEAGAYAVYEDCPSCSRPVSPRSLNRPIRRMVETQKEWLWSNSSR